MLNANEHVRTGVANRMNKLQRAVTAALLALAVGLAGCGAKREPERSPEKKEQGEEKGKGKEKDPIESGAKAMKKELSALRDVIGSGDTAEVRAQAQKLDDTWEKFERKVEAKNPRMYDQIESSLNIILAGVQVVPADNRLINTEIDKLEASLDQLQETKGKPEQPKKVDVQTGAAAMRHQLAQLKTAAEAGDTAKIQEHAEAADRSWTQFEQEIKEKDEEQYRKIEDALHALLAEVKASPPDKQKLNEAITKLDAELEKLTK